MTSSTLLEWIEEIAASPSQSVNSEIYKYLWKCDTGVLQSKINRLDKLRNLKFPKDKKKTGKLNRLIGKAFENLIRFILRNCQPIQYSGNIRTSSSEIDFQLSFEPSAKFIPALHNLGSHGIGEAKCYSSPAKKEWVDKLNSLLMSHNSAIGILFVANGSKKLRRDMRTQIAIFAGQGRLIVPFGWTHIAKINNGENFLKILSDQIVQTKMHSTTLGF